jgi:hypothetical protein
LSKPKLTNSCRAEEEEEEGGLESRSVGRVYGAHPSSGALDVELQHICFLHPVFGMGGGLESRCVGHVYGADGAVRVSRAPYLLHVAEPFLRS